MNSKGHLFISLAKSAIRIVGAGVSICIGSIYPVAIGALIAEIGGILEELVDKR